MTRRYPARAKVNLSLRVGPALPNGRHPLDSVVAFTSRIGDTLDVAKATKLSLAIEGPFAHGLSLQKDNLILSAAHLLASRLGRAVGAKITLTKNLPIASGIGGGSADAAAALIGLNDLWNGDLSRADLCDLGAQLGADVPACVIGQPLRMMGTGEETAPIPALPRMGIVLVNPLLPCLTGPVYQHFDAMGQAKHLPTVALPNLATRDVLLAFLHATPNDLEAPAIDLVPQIADVLVAIHASTNVRLARMSGSGATCFGLYDTLGAAQIGAREIKNKLAFSPVWVEADEISPS
jgi:4-diphosphocytidyl-2-C-methyl-D-erythritol kinase